MQKQIPLILFFLFISTIFTQNLNSYTQEPTSISLSDNLNALNLNPAGLGINRDYQYGFMIKQVPIDVNRKYYLSFINRYASGFAFEYGYDTYDEELKYSIGYGFELFDGEHLNNIFLGAKYNHNSDYSIGLLYRPIDALSIGIVNYKGENTTKQCEQTQNIDCLLETNWNDINYKYNYVTSGFSIRPFALLNTPVQSNKFIDYSNLTIGYDKTMNNLGYKMDSNYEYENHMLLDKNSYQEKLFINLTINPGIDISYSTFKYNNLSNNTKKRAHGLNISFYMKNNGITLSNDPINSFTNTNVSSNSLIVYNYAQDRKGLKLKNEKLNYINLKLDGYFIEEEPTVSPFDFIFDFNPLPFGNSNKIGQQLKAWIDKVDLIAEDERIDGVIIELGNVQTGFAKRKEMYEALMRLKSNDKKILVYSEKGISNSDYYLISMADEIYTHRMASVDLRGFNMEIQFLRGLLDTVSIVPEVVRVSPYKTAMDPLLNRKMSDEMRENYSELVDDLYNVMVNDISRAKGWDNEKTLNVINNGPYFTSTKAVEKGLINDTMFPDDFEDYIKSLNDNKINIIDWDNYKSAGDYVYAWGPNKKPKIAVIYAVGGIISGKSNPGPGGSTMMGDETIMEAIKDAREDKEIDAIVLRVDSGGGSALASDMMWNEVYKTTVEDSSNIKPFIVSMSDIAASGGYYISCQADKILADETSITGSIGVVWGRLNFSELLKRIGINSDNIKQGNNADFGSGSHLLTQEERDRIQESIMDVYDIFKERVVSGRESIESKESLDEIALGRVWSGVKAKELGLVDLNGGLHDAIDVAKTSASIDLNQDIEIIEYPEVRSFNFFNLFDNDKDNQTQIKILELKDIFPNELSSELEALDIIPVLMNDDIQFLMPYKIKMN